MSKEKTRSRVPRVEVLLVLAFLLSVLMWSMARCSRQRRQLAEQATPPPPPQTDTLPADTSSAPPPPVEKIVTRTRLYVTINNLKLRKGPSLQHEVITLLPLYEEVFFLDEVSEHRDTINLGYEQAVAPWVKIRTRKGQEGWVYGAGVDFYKYKRSGVLE